MRVTPTPDQCQYLKSLGVMDHPPGSAAGGICPAVPNAPAPAKERTHSRFGLLVFGIIVAIVLFILYCNMAHGAPASVQGKLPSVLPPTASDPTLTMSGMSQRLWEIMNNSPTHSLGWPIQSIPPRSKIQALSGHENSAEKRELLALQTAMHDQEIRSSQTLAELRAVLNEQRSAMSVMETKIDSLANDRPLIDAIRQAIIAQSEVAAETIFRLRSDLARYSIFLTLLLGALIASGRLKMEGDYRRLSHIWLDCQTEAESRATEVRRSPSQVASTPLITEAPETVLVSAPCRPPRERMAEPRELQEKIIHSARMAKDLRILPTAHESAWGLAAVTNKGNVRGENQDCCLAFRMGSNDVLIVADGCGGVPHGRRAAHLATVGAAVSIINNLGQPSWMTSSDLGKTILRAIDEAGHRLALEGDKLNVKDVSGGLRTTLIVVIADRKEACYAYIGDGGGCVVRASGRIENFLRPQKADQGMLNVLAASLGPAIQGQPVSGRIERSPGDLLIVGTDGVFDRIDPQSFPKDLLRGAIVRRGDLKALAGDVLMELAGARDAMGYIFDDNMTLGLMGDGTQPQLAKDFWQSGPATSPSPAMAMAADSDAPESGRQTMREVWS